MTPGTLRVELNEEAVTDCANVDLMNRDRLIASHVELHMSGVSRHPNPEGKVSQIPVG